jgi:hypothetical protein
MGTYDLPFAYIISKCILKKKEKEKYTDSKELPQVSQMKQNATSLPCLTDK